MIIKGFSICKLHGSIDVDLMVDANKLILIGENGSCKTTIISMLFYSLSKQWMKLLKYDFESIIILFESDAITLFREDIMSFTRLDSDILRRVPPHKRELFNQAILDNNIIIIEELCARYRIPIGRLMQGYGEYEPMNGSVARTLPIRFRNNIDKLNPLIEGCFFLYMPTYRRIEHNLQALLNDGEVLRDRGRRLGDNCSNVSDCFAEVIEFGMADVQKNITSKLANLKESYGEKLNSLTFQFLTNVVEDNYSETDFDKLREVEESTVYTILSRVHENLSEFKITETLWDKLNSFKLNRNCDGHDKVVLHYFMLLLNLQKEIEDKEKDIRLFARICNKYLVNKRFVYDSANFELDVIPYGNNQIIELSQLSSGEKQIISLFNHLYLSGKDRYFVLIDEPELSLSVDWQQTYLADIVKGKNCEGLVAVTHSPFVFDNELQAYARGINQFVHKNKGSHG